MKNSLGYVILKIIAKIACFLVLAYLADRVIDYVFKIDRYSIAETLILAVLSMYIVYYELKKFWSGSKED